MFYIVFLTQTTQQLSPNGTYIIKIGLDYGIPSAGNQIQGFYSRVMQLNQIPDLIHPQAKITLVPILGDNFQDAKKSQLQVLRAGFKFVDDNAVAVLGVGTTQKSIIMSKVIGAEKIPQCCCMSTGSSLSNKQEFPNFFRTVPSDDSQVKAIVLFAVNKGWKFVSLLCIWYLLDVNDEYGKGIYEIMKTESIKNNITLVSQNLLEPGTTDISARLPLIDILNAQSAVIIYAGQSNEFITVYRVAKTLGMTGKGYAWICTDGVSLDFLTSTDYTGVLRFIPTERYESNTTQDFFDAFWYYRDRFLETGNAAATFADRRNANGPQPALKSFVYFAATCVDNIVNGFDRFLKLNTSRTIQGLIDGEYKAEYNMPSMFSIPSNITPTGFGTLDGNGDRISTFDIFNIHADLSSVKVASVSPMTLNYTEVGSIQYTGGSTEVPADLLMPALSATYLNPATGVGAFIITFFIIGLISIVIALIGVVKCRLRVAINYTSVWIHLIMISCLTVALFDMIQVVGIPTQSSCLASGILAPMAISAYYGIQSAKSRRIYRLFYNFLPIEVSNAIPLKDASLGLLFAIPNIIIWIVWVVSDPPIPGAARIGPGQFQWECANSATGLGKKTKLAMIVYNAILILLNVFLAFKTRLVNLRYNEARMINLSVVNLLITYIVVIPVLFTDVSAFQFQPLVRALGVFYIVAVNLGTLFFYKIFTCRNLKDEKASIGKVPPTAGTKFTIPKWMENVDDHVPPAIIFLKKVGCFYGAIEEPRKVLLLAKSPSIVWNCNLKPKYEGSTNHLATEVGSFWVYSPSTMIISHSPFEKRIELTIGTNKYQLDFEQKEMYICWKSFFEVWVVGKDIKGWALGSPTKTRPMG